MGYKLATAAFTFVSGYNERAREEGQRELEAIEVALLTLMSLRAVDDDAEPAFWLKRAEICSLLGIRDTEAGRKRVQRALTALAEAGAIAVPEKYQRGYTPRYRLIHQGGCPASTLPAEVWTPGIPLEGAKGDAERPGVWTPGIPSMDAQHPPEEKEQKEQEAARAQPSNLAVMPFTLSAHEPAPWDAELPEPRNATEAARCPRHPHGTTAACGACGENRQAWTDTHRKAERSRKPAPLRLRIDAGRRVCDNQPHHRLADGTCANCEIHPEDLAALLIGA